jgi:hypothetical protein
MFAISAHYAKADEPYGGGGGGSWGAVGSEQLYTTYPTSTNSDYQLVTGVLHVSVPSDGWYPDESKFIAFKWQTDSADLHSFDIWANRYVYNAFGVGVDNEDLLFSIYELSETQYNLLFIDGLTYDPYNTGEYSLTLPAPKGQAWIDGNYIPTTASPNGTPLSPAYKIRTNVPIEPIRLTRDKYYLIRISRELPCMAPYLVCGNGDIMRSKYAFEIGYTVEEYISEGADHVQVFSSGYTYNDKPVFTARGLTHANYLNNKILTITLFGVFLIEEDVQTGWGAFVNSLKYKIPHGYFFLVYDQVFGWSPNATTTDLVLEFAPPPGMPTTTETAKLNLTQSYLNTPENARSFGKSTVEVIAWGTFCIYIIWRAIRFFDV